MISILYLLLEIISSLRCISCLYGRKGKSRIYDVFMVILDISLLEGVMVGIIPSVFVTLLYVFLLLYCGLNYGFVWKDILINMVVLAGLTSTIQFLFLNLYGYIFHIKEVYDEGFLFANIGMFCIVFFVFPKLSLDRAMRFIKQKEPLQYCGLGLCCILFFYLLSKTWTEYVLSVPEIALLIGCALFVLFFSIKLGILKVRNDVAQAELKAYHTYEKSFEGLIENIRLKQHEFDNHINTIYSQHFLYKSYDELVNVQKQYCETMADENHYNKLLSNGNSVMIGFLYGTFVQIENKGIPVEYHIHIHKLSSHVPIHILIEILGNLIKNAMEYYLIHDRHDVLYISMTETEEEITMEVRNVCEEIAPYEIQKLFQKGYSRKSKNRGLGLFHVKKLCTEYKMDIICENLLFENKNWLSLKIRFFKKEITSQDKDIHLRTKD